MELRPWESYDLALVLEAAQDDYVAKMAGIRRRCGERAARRWMAERDSLVVVERATGQGVGEIGLLVDAEGYSGELYYWLLTGARGRGLATAAARLLCRRALEELRVISAYASDRNPASRRVLEKAGFHRGRRCNRYAGFAGPRDTYTYFLFAAQPEDAH